MSTVVEMTSANILSFVEAGGLTSGHLRRLGPPLWNHLEVRPRVDSSPYGIPLSDYQLSADFANTTDLKGGAFATLQDDAAQALIFEDGVRLRYSRLTDPSYFVGRKYYFEEGLIRFLVSTALTTTFFGHDNSQFPAGRLYLDAGISPVRWRWYQANAAGTGAVLLTFDDIDVKVPTVSGGLPEPVYYQLVRSGSSITLSTYDSDGAQTQTHTGVDEPTPSVGVGGFDGVHSLGKHTIDSSAVIAWWRAAGSNASSTPASSATVWGTPTYSSDVTVLSSGIDVTTLFDAGTNDVYWNLPAFVRVENRYDSSLRARFAATNTPTGTLDSLFTAKTWHTVPAGILPAPIELGGGGEQGRYLAVQLEFNASDTAPLGAGESSFWQVPGSPVLSAQWRNNAWSVPPGPDPIPEPLSFPTPTIDGTLPVLPSRATEIGHSFPAARNQFEAPYAQSYALSDGEYPQRYSVQWVGLTTAERDSLLSFFQKPARVFNWTHPELNATGQAVLAPGTLAPEWQGPGIYNMGAEFVEVTDAA